MTSTSTSSSILFLEEGKAKGAPFGHKHSQVSGAWARQSWWKFNFIPENTHTLYMVSPTLARYLSKGPLPKVCSKRKWFCIVGQSDGKSGLCNLVLTLGNSRRESIFGGRVTLQFALLCTPALFRSTNERKEELSSYVLMLEMSFGAWE